MSEKDITSYVAEMQRYISRVKEKGSKTDALANFKKIGLLSADGKTILHPYI